MENPARVIGQFSEKVVRASETVVDLGRRTIESVDMHRQPMAATLDQTASTLHEQTDRAAGIAHATADRMRATANYVRENDLRAMSKGAGNLVRRYPAQSLAIAALAGFLVARTLGRRADRG